MREAPAEAGASPGRRALRREWFRKHGGSLSGDDTPGKPRGGLGGCKRLPSATGGDGGRGTMEDGACGAGPPLYTGGCGSASTGRASGLGHATRAAEAWRYEGRERNRTHPASLRVSYPRPQAGNRGRFFWRKSRDFCFWFWRAGRRGVRCGTFQGRQEGPPRGFSG